MTSDQFLRLAGHRPEFMALASSAPELIAHLNRDVSTDAQAVSTVSVPANIDQKKTDPC